MNKLFHGDSLDVLKTLESESVDAVVTDPPYELGFMGKSWDNTGIANNPLLWAECLRVLKPGGYLLAFSGTRTYHRMAVAIEDAGFDIRDQIAWCYGQGFPKSLNVFKQLKKKCECGNMEVYENRTKQVGANSEQEAEYFMRFMQEADLSQTKSLGEKQGKVLQSGLSEQGSHSTVLREESKESGEGREERILERGNNLQKTEGELQGSNLSEMSEGVSTNGEERRIHNATQVSDGSIPEQTTNEKGSCASHRPQSEQQQYKQPCAFCKQWGTQATRTLGVGTALKPSIEPICVARKPIEKGLNVAENCLKYGTGGINIDESRVGTGGGGTHCNNRDVEGNCLGHNNAGNSTSGETIHAKETGEVMGRFPANLIHDNSEEVRECFPEAKGMSGGGKHKQTYNKEGVIAGGGHDGNESHIRGDSGNASRFFKSIPIEEQDEIQEECTDMEEKLEKLGFLPEAAKSIIYQAKASKSERNKGLEDFEEVEVRGGGGRVADGYDLTDPNQLGLKEAARKYGAVKAKKANIHPTVKPIALMEYLIKMVTPKGGIVLDPFMGSGSTGVAAKQNGYSFIGIDMTEEYIEIAKARISAI